MSSRENRELRAQWIHFLEHVPAMQHSTTGCNSVLKISLIEDPFVSFSFFFYYFFYKKKVEGLETSYPLDAIIRAFISIKNIWYRMIASKEKNLDLKIFVIQISIQASGKNLDLEIFSPITSVHI